MQKKVALFSFGLNDGFCNPSSPRHIVKGDVIYSKTKEALKNGEIHFDRFFDVSHPNDTKVNYNFDEYLEQSKTARFRLISKEFFSVDNSIALNTLDGDIKVINGLDIDFILNPNEYEIHFIGLDINGCMLKALKRFKELGFTTVVYSNLAKPFNKSVIEEFPKNGIKFCSYQSYKKNKRSKDGSKK